MALQGDLATLPARDLFGMLVRTRASGRLSVSRGMAARRFYLRDGRVALASSSEEETLLGRLLVERGLIDADELARVLHARAGARTRLGKTLTEEGLVTAADLSRVLAEKIERLVLDTLAWKDGQFYFDEEAPAHRRAVVSASVDLAALLERPPARPGPDTVPITDADVIEMRAIVAQLEGDPAPTGPAPRPRRRRSAVA